MIRSLLAAALLLLAARPGAAQHSLVLSGGGARGLSHAGAIVALEELGYRPAFIVGTSMGAIVGALYAAGYTPDSIRDVIARQNWLETFAAEPLVVGPRRELRRPLLSFGISRGRFFGGFIPETGINQRLIELLFDAGVRAGNDFDRLPIPYRAVAADLADGAEVVLRNGDLPRAVRASMAVPGVFAPVRWNDAVLVDGGVANNLPVSVARAARAAPVIAIDVLRPAVGIEERSALDLGVRALRLLIENARPADDADILVLPPLQPGLSETYFPADATNLVQSGYDAVIAQVQPPDTPQTPARRTEGAAPERVTSLRVEGGSPATERLVRRVMRGAVRDYDAADITRRVAALHMTGLFQSVWPRIERTADAAELTVEVTRIASTSAAGGARWDNDVGAGAWLQLRQHIDLRTPVELRLSGTFDQLATAGALDVSFFSSLVPGLTWNGGAHAVEEEVRLFDGDAIVDRPLSRRSGGWFGAELHGLLGDWYITLLGRADHLRQPNAEGWAAGPWVRLARRPAPDRVVGIDPILHAEVRGGDFEYQRASLQLGPRFRIRRIQLAPVALVAATSRAAPLHSLPASSHAAAPWLAAGERRAPHHAAVGFDAALPILLSGYARARVRAASFADAFDGMRREDAWTLGIEAGAIWPTVLGPIAVGYAAAHTGERRLNIEVGARF